MFKWFLLLTIFTITFGDESLWFDVPPKEIFLDLAKRRRDEVEDWRKALVRSRNIFTNLPATIPSLIHAYNNLTAHRQIARPEALPLYDDIIYHFNFKPIPSQMSDFKILDVVYDVYSTIVRQLDGFVEVGFIPMRYYQAIWTLLGTRLVDLISPRVFMLETSNDLKDIFGKQGFSA